MSTKEHPLDVFQKELQRHLEDNERQTMRPLQLKAFKCSATCAGDTKATFEETQSCYERCNMETSRATAVVEHEVKSLMNIVQGCVQQCQATAYDSMRGTGRDNPPQSAIEQAQREFDQCSSRCGEQAMRSLVQMKQRIQNSL